MTTEKRTEKRDLFRFWMVWNPQGRAPTVQHSSREKADWEARRLAVANPGTSFIVLKAVGGRIAETPEPASFNIIPRIPTDDIPF